MNESPQHQSVVLVHLEYLRERMDAVVDRLDKQNGKIDTHSREIARLQERTSRIRSESAKLGAGLGAFVSALVAGLWHLFGGGK